MARNNERYTTKRRSKGDGSLFQIREEDGLPDIEKKGLPDKEFNAPTKRRSEKHY